ncbi:ankyrin repeat protein [Aspergillus saccharolyticus JOP 1030-1]|uniref:Ankyrin repeat protein n=1 Tax=Aspergillus saccharolyticus JOP 1030-1 TaxID=1450539 RepID=A0A319A5H4_9EURO|nr:ankyrin repeat protein [Aspergillus saccharolyticus JOP 1030-1]PYH42662.1 ankyrin repeat protein [Aspergillus saccharolyticus JOP 1030-1]
MASPDDYSVGWVCTLPIEVEAAKATFDCIHDNLLPPNLDLNNNNNNYILGSLQGHNVILAYPNCCACEDGEDDDKPSLSDVATQLQANFASVRIILMVGIAGAVPNTNEDIRLGDIVVSNSAVGRPGAIQYAANGEQMEDQILRGRALGQPTSSLLLTATRKAETAAIFGDSKIDQYVADIVRKDPVIFSRPSPEQDFLFEPNYGQATIDSGESACRDCNPGRVRSRQPRETPRPTVHYGLIATGHHAVRHGATRDTLPYKQGVLSSETGAIGLKDAAQYLIIRGICNYADSHRSKLWHPYAAVAAAAYAKEVLSFIPKTFKTVPLTPSTEAGPILSALLLTRPEVDRKSLILLKGRRADGTCEWLLQHPRYQEWLSNPNQPLLWISGGPGKGKTMLAIYITEVLEPVGGGGGGVTGDVLLYYFCSNRDKNRNTALTILRGLIHQWIDLQPHLAQCIKNSFEGTETTKYTVSSFVALWSVFLTMLQHSGSSQVVCVLDGLDECEKELLGQFLDAVGNYLSKTPKVGRPRLKLILLSRPHPAISESRLGQYLHIKLDDSNAEIAGDVKRYISAKVTELASEQNLSDGMVAQVRQALLAGADGTFLWVGFVANELQGRSWDRINEIIHQIPKGLAGVYQRLLQQIADKEALVPILQWVVLAARPLTIDELTAATDIKASGTLTATEVTKGRLRLCGPLVKIEGDVVNLVHQSAKEFFQSNQVNVKGISMFYMDQSTHRTLMRTCLAHVERCYVSTGAIDERFDRGPLFLYAAQYWPVHFYHANDAVKDPSEFSRPFFGVKSAIRDSWWRFYWEQERNGGNAPAFTLLHLASYLGNVAWARWLISKHVRLVSRKDNYGRTPLCWALLLDHGARVNVKDRGRLTALHIAVNGQHKDIVSMLLGHGAHLESKSEHGDTPLIRAIQTNAREIIQMLLEHGARVDELPTPSGVASLRSPSDPMEERVEELLGLREQIFLARYKQASRKINLVMKALGLSFRFPIFVAFDRWENMPVLQEVARRPYREFFVQLAMTDLPTQVFREVAPGDLQALLVIAVLVGSEAKLAAVRHGWREGDAITARAFSHWAAIACQRGAEESLHYGVRDFLNDFDTSIRSGNREDNVARTVNDEPRPIEYFSGVIAEFYEGYIGGGHEVDLFNDANQACAGELAGISQSRDSSRLLLFLTRAGRDRFLNLPSAACLILCQENAMSHQWLIGETIPELMSTLISKQPPGSLRKRACKTLVECLIIGKQHGLILQAAILRRSVSGSLQSLPDVHEMVSRIIDI